MKRCTACGQDKPLSKFYISKRVNSVGRYSECKQCHRARTRTRSRSEMWRKTLLLPWNEDRARELRERQKNSCPICGDRLSDSSTEVALDHDHLTGRVRGLLCRSCNWGLGAFRDSSAKCLSAAQYLDLKGTVAAAEIEVDMEAESFYRNTEARLSPLGVNVNPLLDGFDK